MTRRGRLLDRLREREQTINELVAALDLLLKAYDYVLPGIRHIAVPDYEILNRAPLTARHAIARAKAQDESP